MKILVVSTSRHGFTDHCLGLLAGELPAGLDLWPLGSRPGVPDWDSYDVILIGGPVYFGRWSAPLVRWLNLHAGALGRHPRLAAFVVSLSPRTAAQTYLKKALPAALAGRVQKTAFFGGGVKWRDLAWWEKLILKRVRGIETDVSNLDLGEIQALAAWMTGSILKG